MKIGIPDEIVNALTVDVEDYFMVSAFSDVAPYESWGTYDSRVERNTKSILDILDAHSVKATFFIVGWVADKSPGLVKEIEERGHEIGCHGYTHRMLSDLTEGEFRDDTRRAKNILEDLVGHPILGYRAPSFSLTRRTTWAWDVLLEEGFRYDSSVFPIHHDRYGYPEFERFSKIVRGNGKGDLMEIPATTLRLFGVNLPCSGGGYFRLYPLRVTEWMFERLNRLEGQPVVFYIHPWELDPGQPRMPGKLLSIFRHYVNIAGTGRKFDLLLSKYRFGPIRQVFNLS